MTTTLTYNLDPFTTSLTARGISSGTISNLYFECTTGCPTSTSQRETINFNRVKGAWYFDASVSYNFDIGGAETTAFFNIRNIANKDPAQIPPTSVPYVFLPTNLGLYDTLGRNFRAGLRFRL